MLIKHLIDQLESFAPLSLQEEYDNAGLITGDGEAQCTGVLCALDVTAEVVDEAIQKNCNLIVAHHPVVFRGLKRIVDPVLIKAIKNDMALYACHTNIDNVSNGVNGRIADKLDLKNRKILAPKGAWLKKLFTFVPPGHFEAVREALFAVGAGHTGNYSECSFSHAGTGTFTPGEAANPFLGKQGIRESAGEIKLEMIFRAYQEREVINALLSAHPYEEVAYDIVRLDNKTGETGAGIIGELPELSVEEFLAMLMNQFGLTVIKHTRAGNNSIRKVAVCGGVGSFLISKALAAGADAYVTADLKYHEFFTSGSMLLCDIGHFESEQFTADLFVDILLQKFPTFAVLKSEVNTNPVSYFTGK